MATITNQKLYLLLDDECNIARTVTAEEIAKEKDISVNKARRMLNKPKIDWFLIASYEKK